MSVRTENLESAKGREGLAVRFATRVWDYVGLTRPRVLNLVLLTAPPACVMGRGTWPSFGSLLLVLLGCGLIGAGCGALNAWWERDRDAKMARTCVRPLPTGRLNPRQALIFGVLINAVGLGALFIVGGWLPVILGCVTLVHYLVIYTIWLKPRSAQNIVVGGAAGAAAPVIADAAVNGQVGIWSLVLFAIVFFWQPPHVWAITLYRKKEYEAAGFPMMPSVVGDRGTRWRMLIYALVLFPVTLLPWIGGVMGPVYGATALLGGGVFIGHILLAIRADDHLQDRRVFVTSLAYLSLLFAEMVVELIFR